MFGVLILVRHSLSADWTMEQYLTTAAENNSEVQAAFENWQAALSKVAYSNSLPDPKITYGHFIKSVETRVGPQKFRLGLAQMIPWIGKLSARKDLASQQANLAEAQLAVAYASLRSDLIEAFLDLRFLRQAVGIQKDYIDLARAIEQTAQSQSKVGGSRADVIQSQMELHRLDYELNSLQEQLLVASARVEAILNVRDASQVALPGDIEDYVRPPSSDLQELSDDQLQQVNPELKALESLHEVQKAKKSLTRQDRYPDVTVGVDWIKTDRALMVTPDSGKDPVVAFVSLNIPLWVGKYRSQEREASHQTSRVASLLKQTLFNKRTEQKQVLYRFSDANNRVVLFQDQLIPEAEEALSILTEAYKTGRADFERLQNSEIALLKLQLQLERARSDLGISVAKYQALTGVGQ